MSVFSPGVGRSGKVMAQLHGRACALLAGLAIAPAYAAENAVSGAEYDLRTKPVVHGVAAVPLPPQNPAAAPAPSALPQRAATIKKVCDEIFLAAKNNRLPRQFLLRLIWQESRFNPQAVSPAGARGIAQFMPATAQWRGLEDPFDWSLSIQHSGRWLGELRQQFGNLGLAAAAYNAGPGRVQDWLAGTSGLPEETRAYVHIVTGRKADDWIGMREPDEKVEFGSDVAECPPQGLVAALRAEPAKPNQNPGASGETQAKPAESIVPKPSSRPWGLQLIGDRSKSAAMQQYAAMRQQFPTILGPRAPEVFPRRVGGRRPTFWYQIRVSEVSRQSATTLCTRLKSAGGQCLVIRN